MILLIRERISHFQHELFQETFSDCKIEAVHEASQKEIDGLLGEGAIARSFMYGEIEFFAFKRILRIATKNMELPIRKFYDLGSGCGRAIVTAALCCDINELIGIEVLTSLHEMAENIREK